MKKINIANFAKIEKNSHAKLAMFIFPLVQVTKCAIAASPVLYLLDIILFFQSKLFNCFWLCIFQLKTGLTNDTSDRLSPNSRASGNNELCHEL